MRGRGARGALAARALTPTLVRSYQESDELAVIALWHECGLTRPWNNAREDIARKLLVQPDLFLVGLHHGRLAATAMGGYDGHRGWVNYLAVAPACRRQGFASTLMKHLEDSLIDKGCPKLNLQVRLGNAEAVAFYRHLGYLQDDVVSLGKRLIDDAPDRS